METITIRIPLSREAWWDIKAHWRRLRQRDARSWRLATVKGVPGITYFDAMYDWDVDKCYLDGVDVTTRCAECDVSAGWARLYDVNPTIDGTTCLTSPTRLRYHYGKVKVTKRGAGDGVEHTDDDTLHKLYGNMHEKAKRPVLPVILPR